MSAVKEPGARIRERFSSRSYWKSSRFNYSTEAADGTCLLYNSSVGALARIAPADIGIVRQALHQGFRDIPEHGAIAELILNGFFVPADLDEAAIADSKRQIYIEKSDTLELAMMPNENCNFRCAYCYESFQHGKMNRDVVKGIIRYVEKRSSTLKAIHIGWFGGEPLTALEIVLEISNKLKKLCNEAAIEYSSTMVTNGYLLTSNIADLLFGAEVRQFQITLDGPEEEHNRLRMLGDGKSGTFKKIYSNLRMLRRRNDSFRVVIRVNFDPHSAKRMKPFFEQFKRDFETDNRFFFDFHPVGQWGGKNDGYLDVCGTLEGRLISSRLFHLAADMGFNIKPLRQRLEPCGSICYAADPRSLVIGSDGTVYKCTVAFNDPINKVGQLLSSGDLVLDRAKLDLWVANGEEKDKVCQACFFRPPCQGNACPLERIRTGLQPCPNVKHNIDEVLRILADETVMKLREQQNIE